jgi:RNA polymerase sigma factor (sigma-70 family)
MSDRGLLDHFTRGGDSSESAFATLVERHGPMVLRVCRNLLADGHLAEDAFQVTFLLLARRARSIHNPDALAGWLHRVARRVALRARAGIRRRNDLERPVSGELAVDDDDPVERDERRAVVHQEIDRLAEGQRLPILLCALEGLSHEEAADRLRWPVGTVKSRLARGRRRLEGRLARRGLAPAIAFAAGAAGASASAASVPLALAVATTRAALQKAMGASASAGTGTAPVSTSIAHLMHQELNAMAVAKAGLTASAAVAAGAAVALVAWTLAAPPPPARPARDIEPRARHAPAAGAKTPSVPRLGLTVVPKSADAVAARQAPRPVEARANLVVERPAYHLTEFGRQVDRAIGEGVHFLTSLQLEDGSWKDVEADAKTGVTSLVTLALLRTGERPYSPSVRRALAFLRGFGPSDLRSTYAISLQTQVFAAALPEYDHPRIAANVGWLERAQIKPGDAQPWPGSWTYSDAKHARPGDNSNTHYALLGLLAAREAGVPVTPSVWELARSYWERTQKGDGSWAYTPDSRNSTATMTCAGVSSVAISGPRRFTESLRGATVQNCGQEGADRTRLAGIDWLARHFQVNQNFGGGKQWRLYYLDGLECAGRLTGVQFFGGHDWYRTGGLELVHEQNKHGGFW